MSGKKQFLKTGEKVLFAIVGVFIFLAIVAYIALESYRLSTKKQLFKANSYEFTELAEKGSALFRTSRCTSCHRALRNGTNMGLSLDGVGSLRSYDWLYSFLKEPEKTYGSATVDHGPSPKEAAYVASMPDDELKAIAKFISELKSDQGSASAPMPPEGRSEFIDNMVKTWAPKEWEEKYGDIRDKPKADSSESSKSEASKE